MTCTGKIEVICLSQLCYISLFNNNIWVVNYRSSISAKNVSFWTVLVNRYIISKAGMAISGMQTSESPLITLAFFSFTSKFQCRAGASEVSPEPSLVWCYIRVSQKNTFFKFRFGGRITGANGCPEATKKFQHYRQCNRHLTIDFGPF